MDTTFNSDKNETSRNKTVESLYFTPQNSSCLVNEKHSDSSVDSGGSKVDETRCSLNDTGKFDCTGSTALVEEVCNTTTHNKSRVQCAGGDRNVMLIVDSKKNQTKSSDKFQKEKQKKEFCCCLYEGMSEADTEYMDFTPASPLKCSNFDENCFCHQSDDMSSFSMNSSEVQVIKRNYKTNRRMIKIRIKTSSSKECNIEGDSTENGIKISISPRNKTEKSRSSQKGALNETYSITSTSEMGTSSVETGYEFRKNLKNELKRSPAAVKVLNYLESLSDSRKKTPDHTKLITETVPCTTGGTKLKNTRANKQSVNSVVDDEEFHDCCDKTILSSDTTGTSEYEDTTESFDTSQVFENVEQKDTPLITITQEMSAEMVVTSKFEINKQKLRRMSEKRERRQSRESRGSPDKIIDDNFCNEILDKMNQLTESFHESNNNTDSDTIEKAPLDDTTLETSATSISGPQKPPRTFAFRRSQDNKPKVPKLHDIHSSLESLDMYLYEEMKQLKLFKFNQYRKSSQMSPVDECNYVTGGWKVSPAQETSKKTDIGWTFPIQSPKKFEPGWVKPSPPIIPSDIVNMLHYSDDEVKKRTILSSNARAEPQQTRKSSSSSEKQQLTLGPKIDIDTVDAIVHTPSSSSNKHFEEFANNTRARSTPRRKETPNKGKNLAEKIEPYLKFKRTKDICKKFLEMERNGDKNPDVSVNPLPSMDDFLEKERVNNEICKKCCREVNPTKRKNFHQKAFKRTKSLFAASKRKIGAFKRSSKPKLNEVQSDSDPYCTPEQGNTPYKSPEKPIVPQHRRETFNYNAPLPQSPQKPLLEVTPPQKSPLHLKIKLSPKRLFASNTEAKTSTPGSPIIPHQGNYKSFEDQEQNLAATMGEILSHLREIIEGNPAEMQKKHVNVLLHQQEPDYDEISPTQMQMQTKISPQIQRIERNNNEYIMVNNDPMAIYATVIKKSKSLNNLNASTSTSHDNTPSKPIRTKRQQKSSRRRITFNVQPSSNTLVTKADDLNTVQTHTRQHRSNSCNSLYNNSKKMTEHQSFSRKLFGSDQCVKVSVKEFDLDARKYHVIHENYQKHAPSNKFEQEIKQIEYDTNIMDQYMESLNNILAKKFVVDGKNIKKATEDFLHREINSGLEQGNQEQEADQDEKNCYTDGDHLSTGGTYKSFPRPDAKRSDDLEQSFSLNYSSGDVDSQNNEAGYDEIDFKPFEAPRICVNTIDEVISEEEFDQYFNSDEKQRQVTSLDDTLTSITNSSSRNSNASSQVASPVKPPRRRGSLYRSLKTSLRNSFRKSRDFIKQEQDKLVQLFDKNTVIDAKNALPKPARSFINLDDYKKYYNDQNAEEIYKKWCEKLSRTNSHSDLHQKPLLDLINQISAQRQIKKQLRNALEICRSSKEFDASSELVEAERLLLVSNLKEAASKKELMLIDNDLYANVKQTVNNIGMIVLSDFEFPLKDSALYDTLYNYFYVCVATYKDQVKASYAKEREGNKVSFRGFDIKFWEVEPDYQIKIEVFVLSLRKNNRGANESRLSANKNLNKMSPRRFFRGASVDKSPSKRVSEIEFSQYVSQGYMFVTPSSFVSYSDSLNRRQIPDAHIDLPYYSSSNYHQYLKKAGDHYVNCIEDYRSFRMTQVIYNSHMTGQLEMSIKSEVVFDGSKMSGFLTIGESVNGTIAWNRRWCKIDGMVLKFWNYPQEANDGKDPVEVIDISKCENDYIYQADRAICARPRAIVIEQADASTTVESKPGYYFLVTDSKEELRDWLRELNKILRFVRDWKL